MRKKRQFKAGRCPLRPTVGFVCAAFFAGCCPVCEAGKPSAALIVESRRDAGHEWAKYEARTVDRIPGFSPVRDELDEFGGLKGSGDGKATGFFRVQKIDGRWWLIDPLGNRFISKGVATVVPGGGSKRKRAALKEKYGTNEKWFSATSEFLLDQGFNTLGGWSHVAPRGREPARRIPYTRLVNPMLRFNSWRKKMGHAPNVEGYPKYVPPVFVKGLDDFIEKEISAFKSSADDPYLIGYFIDNEIPWLDTMLRNCLTRFPTNHVNYTTARTWLDKRHGETNFPLSKATDADRQAFVAFGLETYLRKVTAVLRRVDPNHLFLGCRFFRVRGQLENPEFFKVAGRYMDVVSVNHYKRWQPDPEETGNWVRWADKPFLVTEFYTRGEDTGLPNMTGAGWNVRTQEDRGVFYENFANELLKNRGCVGWHWFKYMDNDPEDLSTDPSNRDSNKGILRVDFTPYEPLLRHMKALNECVYGLIRFHDHGSGSRLQQNRQ